MKPIVAANWKLHKTPQEAEQFAEGLVKSIAASEHQQLIVFPPAIDLLAVAGVFSHSSIGWGAQNIYFEENGAFTGENSPAVVKAIGASHVLVGHSERRQLFFEDDAIIAKKVQAAQKNDLIPILCIGETLVQRETNKTKEILVEQLKQGLALVDVQKSFMIAYEPVWAIGTGKVATPKQADESHAIIRNFLDANDLERPLAKVPILYGGSVKPENSREIFSMPNVDGFLVGGASLQLESFLAIYQNC